MAHRNSPAAAEFEGTLARALQGWEAAKLVEAVAEAERCHRVYERTLEDHFRGRCRAHAVLSARIAWTRAESRVVDLRAGDRRPVEWLS